MTLKAKVILPILAGVIIIGLWCAAKAVWRLPAYLLPGPGEVAAAAWAERATLWRAAGDTLDGAVRGFLAAGAGGFLLALGLAASPRIRHAIYPWVIFWQMIPVIVLAPIIVLWRGPGLPGVWPISFLIGFFPVVANTTQGLLSADRNSLELFRLYRARWWQEMLWLRVPGARPYFFTGLKIAATLAVIGAIMGEIFAGSASGTGGLGFLVYVYKSSLQTPELFAAALTACGLGFLFVSAVSWCEWFFLRRWHESVLVPEK